MIICGKLFFDFMSEVGEYRDEVDVFWFYFEKGCLELRNSDDYRIEAVKSRRR